MVEIGKNKIIDLGERQITLHAHPDAHTEADMIVFDEKTRILWAGDLVFSRKNTSCRWKYSWFHKSFRDYK